MKLKITLTVIATVLFAALKTKAQVPCAYNFTTGSDTYQSLSNPTSLNNGQVWTSKSIYTLSLGFNFPLASGRSTNILEVRSGSLDFGSGFPDYLLLIYHWPYGGDLLTDKGSGTSTSLSPVSYEISGVPGSRIAKIEFQNAGLEYDYESTCTSPTGADYVNFQYWLYEATGRVEVRFGPSSVTNPHSYNCTTNTPGPHMKFLVDASYINPYGNATTPLVASFNTSQFFEGNPMNGTTAANGTVYTFDIDPGYAYSIPCAYTYVHNTGAYQALSNPISVNNGQVWTQSFSSSFTLPLGFNFPLTSGRTTSSVIIRGGSLELTNSAPYLLLIYHWPFGGNMLTDKGFGTATSLSPISYEITGTTGSRIAKIEFQNAGLDYDFQSSCDLPTGLDYVNFQYWLYEATGKIEVHFGPSSVANPQSYNCANNSSLSGPFMKFIVDNSFLNPYGYASNPLVATYDNTGIVYGNPMNGTTAANGTIYIFNPDPTYAVALHESPEQATIKVFPNPVQDLLTISGDIGLTHTSYEVINTLGQTVLKGTMEKQVNVSALVPGMYTICIQGLGTRKFIKE